MGCSRYCVLVMLLRTVSPSVKEWRCASSVSINVDVLLTEIQKFAEPLLPPQESCASPEQQSCGGRTLSVTSRMFAAAIEASGSDPRGHLCRSCWPAQCLHRGVSLHSHARCPKCWHRKHLFFLISRRSTLPICLWSTRRPNL